MDRGTSIPSILGLSQNSFSSVSKTHPPLSSGDLLVVSISLRHSRIISWLSEITPIQTLLAFGPNFRYHLCIQPNLTILYGVKINIIL